MAGVLMPGASGVWIGTRFPASTEATIHEDYRDLILQASGTRTQWYHDLYDVNWPGAPHRALKNSTAQKWRETGGSVAGGRPGENEVIGYQPDGGSVVRYQCYTPQTETKGNVEAMSLWSGQGVALVRETMPSADIVDEIYSQAKETIQKNYSAL